MLQFVVCVKGRAAEVFNRPFLVPHRNVAVRDFTDEINRSDPANPLNKHPDDFDLYLVAQFDDNTGAFIAEGAPTVLVRGKDLVASS